jgi:hypothetical protein
MSRTGSFYLTIRYPRGIMPLAAFSDSDQFDILLFRKEETHVTATNGSSVHNRHRFGGRMVLD